MTTIAAPFTRNHEIRDAIGQAIYDVMACDPTVHLFGEGCEVKMHYDAPRILADFSSRVHTLPISEDANTNFAVGASLLGVKPVVDVITADFLYRTMDSICNTAAKLNFVLGPNGSPSTIVIRSEFMIGGPTTGQRPEAIFAHIPGLTVVVPSTPHDAYGLMLTAFRTPGVTIFFEDRMIEDGNFAKDAKEIGEAIPFGASLWCRKGQRGNTTIVTYGIMRQVVERALGNATADPYEEGHELRCDVIDLRSIYPIDFAFIGKMLERTGKLLIVEPDIKYGGVGAEIAATIAERMPHVRVKRVGARRTTIPASMSLHSRMLPTEQEIVDAIRSFD